MRGIVEHRHLARLRLARAQPAHRALARAPADRCGVIQIGFVHRARPVVVALHCRAFAGERRRADGVAAGFGAAGEAVAGDQSHLPPPPAGAGAFGVGDAGDGAGGVLRLQRAGHQALGVGLSSIDEVERRPVPREQGRVGEAGIGVLRHCARHGHRLLGERPEGALRKVRGGDDGLPVARKDAQAEAAHLGADDLFRLAEAAARVEGAAAQHHRVGGIGAEPARTRDQAVEQIGGITRLGGSHDR